MQEWQAESTFQGPEEEVGRPQLPGSSSWVKLVVTSSWWPPPAQPQVAKTFFSVLFYKYSTCRCFIEIYNISDIIFICGWNKDWCNFLKWIPSVPMPFIEKLLFLHWFTNASKIKQPAACYKNLYTHTLSSFSLIIVLLIP